MDLISFWSTRPNFLLEYKRWLHEQSSEWVEVTKGNSKHIPLSGANFTQLGVHRAHHGQPDRVHRGQSDHVHRGQCNTPGVSHLLSSGFERKHDMLNGNQELKFLISEVVMEVLRSNL